MFERVTIAQDDVDVGAIAEALIYYGNAAVVVQSGKLPVLVEKFGYENLVRCLDSGLLKLIYDRHFYAVSTVEKPFRLHGFLIGTLAQTAKDGKRIRNAADDIEHAMSKRFGSSVETKKRAKLISEKIVERDEKAAITEQAKSDVLDLRYMNKAIQAIIAINAPGYKPPSPLLIDVIDSGKGLIMTTNLDYAALRMSEADLLSKILTARMELVFSGNENSDLWLNPVASSLLELRINSIVSRLSKSQSEINCFHSVEFDGRTIREVINKGERSLNELIELAENDETRKFKQWLAQHEQGTHLIKEYDKAIFEKSWVGSLPTKCAKMVGFTGVGFILDVALGSMGVATITAATLSAATGLTLSTGDEFIAPRLIKGWKPNQFVDGPAKKFLSSTKQNDK